MNFGRAIKYILTFVTAGISAVMMVSTVTENVECNLEKKEIEEDEEK